MGKDWAYAKLSVDASKVGGPEKLVELIEQAGFQKGVRTMAPLSIVLTVTGVVTGALVGKYSPNIKKAIKKVKSKHITKAEKEAAKRELIEGIKKYDEEKSAANEKNNAEQ